MSEIDLVRTNPAIDPQLHIWGWEIPVYLFLGGMAAGAMILSALFAKKESSRWLRLLPFAAPVLLSIGMAALFLDLAYKMHVYRFYLAFRWSSPMSWGAWILIAIYPVALLLGILRLSENEITNAPPKFVHHLRSLRRFAERHEKTILSSNLAFGVGLGVYTGILLASLGRPAWNSAILGPLFLASGFSAGAALILLFPLAPAEHKRLARIDMGAIGVELLLIALFLIGLSTIGAPDGSVASDLFLGGPYTAVFWSLVVFAGLLVPLTMKALETKAELKPTLIAPALVLCGGFALRWILVAAGQA